MTDSDHTSTNLNRSGGADLNAGRDLTVSGDVVGHDKITHTEQIETGGGAFVKGDVVVDRGSIFVGHDQIVITGDQQYDVHGLANPYLGLQSFIYADHAKYAGREKLIAETVARLTASSDPLSLLFVTGASGSGKSSFVQAGVLPALEKHYAALSVKWAVFRPSRDPLAALADALWRQLGLPQFDAHAASPADFGDFLQAHTPSQQVNVIVIDQFEELFTQAAVQPRDALFNLLTQLPPFRLTHTHIIATVRADYLPELFALPALYDIAKHGIDLRVMSVDELREAIQQPLRAAYPDKNKRFQSELVERLAHDSAEDAAYLPLLQVTLEEIWRKGALTVGSYTNLTDAIKQRADKVLACQDYDAAQPNQPRSPDEQAAILNLCLDLVDVSLDDEARRDVRRRRSKDELTSGAPERARLIDALTQARLLSVEAKSGEQMHVEVDLIHETLLANWDRLRQTISERRHELRQRVRFEQQLKEWLGQDRADDYLLSGVRLAEARELERRDDIALHSADAKDFLRRSVEREEARRQKELNDARKLAETERLRAEEQARSAAKLRQRAIYLTGALVFALMFGVIAVIFGIQSNQSASEARRQAHIALSRQLVLQAQPHLNDQLDLALLLSVEADRAADTSEVHSNLLSALQYSPRLESFLRGHTGAVKSVAFSPDGKTLASGSADKTIILWDASNPQATKTSGVPLTGHTDAVYSVAFSPDSKLLASGSVDKTIVLWDVSNPQAPKVLGAPLIAHTDAVYSVAFSPDGKILASGGADRKIILWDVADPQAPQQLGMSLIGQIGTVYSVAFSPDGKILASGSSDNRIRLWDMTDPQAPQQLGTWLNGYAGSVLSVVFSPDGKTLASAGSSDNTISVWDVRDAQAPHRLGTPLTGHTKSVYSVAFSPDGKTLASGSADKTIILWNVSDPQAPQRLGTSLSGYAAFVLSVAFSPDGKRLASGDSDAAIILWNVTELEAPQQLGVPQQLGASLSGHTGFVSSLAFSLDGKTLASGSTDRTIILWGVSNPLAPQRLGTLVTDHTGYVTSVAFSPDGKTLASGSADKTIILWDVSDPQAPHQLGSPFTGHTYAVDSVAFSPDGKTLASGSADKTIILWDVSGPQAPRQLGSPLTGHSHRVRSVAFSPDGKTLASGSADNTLRLWDVADPQAPKALSAPLTGHTDWVESVAFSLDGKTLASSSYGRCDFFGCVQGEIILWDVSDPHMPQRLAAPLAGPTNDSQISDVDRLGRVAFSPDGRTLATGGCGMSVDGRCERGSISLWDVDLYSWQLRACRIAGRNLIRAEWAQYMGDEPYRKTCEQWPLEPEATLTP